MRAGQYYYAPHRRMWGIWRNEGLSATFIGDYPTKEEAKSEVYRLNGWKQKSN